jgi:hypothetical protein
VNLTGADFFEAAGCRSTPVWATLPRVRPVALMPSKTQHGQTVAACRRHILSWNAAEAGGDAARAVFYGFGFTSEGASGVGRCDLYNESMVASLIALSKSLDHTLPAHQRSRHGHDAQSAAAQQWQDALRVAAERHGIVESVSRTETATDVHFVAANHPAAAHNNNNNNNGKDGKDAVDFVYFSSNVEEWRHRPGVLDGLAGGDKSAMAAMFGPLDAGETAADRSEHVWIGGKDVSSQTHYDCADNFYVQITGRKRVVLFPPAMHATWHLFPRYAPRS